MEEKKTNQASKGLLGFLVVIAFLCNFAVIVFAVLNATGIAGRKYNDRSAYTASSLLQ